MLSTLQRAEEFLRALAANGRNDVQLAATLADSLSLHRRAVSIAYGFPPPPDGRTNGLGERGSSARGAEPRLLLDFGAARCVCDCGHTFALRDSRPLTHFASCPKCKRAAGPLRIENLLRAQELSFREAPVLEDAKGVRGVA